jgi:oxygen-dependent protoporphyrinogen oxidase
VSLGYRLKQVGRSLEGFGFVVPRLEGRLILSCSFSSVKYPGRAPDGHVLLRVFIGGAYQGHLLALADDELVELARLELAELLHMNGEPLLAHVTRHKAAMPQYHVGHCERVRQINDDLQRFPSLALAGSGLYGVGIPHCIHSGEEAAARVSRTARRPKELAAAV